MKALITTVAAVGLALTVPAFAQNTTKGPVGQYDHGGAERLLSWDEGCVTE